LAWEFCATPFRPSVGDLIGRNFGLSTIIPAWRARRSRLAGYRSVNPDLPVNWSDAAKLIDLGNMCSFLERPEDYQQSFRTARAVIESTLEHFGY